MATKIQLANSALGKIGVASLTLSDIQNESNLAAKKVVEQFPLVRDELLRQHPWNFAIKRITLGEDEEAAEPDWGYAHAFNLPCDFIRLVNTKTPYEPYRIEQRTLLCNYSEVHLEYVYRVTNVCDWDTIFVSAFTHRLAAELARSVKNNQALATTMMAAYEGYLDEARFTDSQELQQPDQDLQGYSWIHARQGGHF